MNIIEVACPHCASIFSLDTDEISGPPGTVPQLMCGACKHKGPLHQFEKALRRIQKTAERAMEEERRREWADHAKIAKEEQAQQQRAQAAAEEEQRYLAKEQAAADRKIAEEARRRKEIEATRVTCPICDNLCSLFGKACPRCAHPIQGRGAAMPGEIPEDGPTSLKSIGWLYIGLGILLLVAAIAGRSLAAAAVGVNSVAAGVIMWAIAGIWLSCEVAARR